VIAAATAAPRVSRPQRTAWPGLLVRNRLALAALVILVVLTLVAVSAPILTRADPTATNLPERLLSPMSTARGASPHLLGTDSLGRDVLVRIVYGGRISLTIGFGAAIVALLVGVPLGLLAGYFGGITDTVIMRLADIQLGFPTILLYISIFVVLRPDVWTMLLILGVAGWVNHARVIRAQTLAQRHMEYVEAARAVGANHLQIIVRHVLPNVLAPTIVIASFSIATIIITAASLSFLGMGLPPSTADWGLMIADGVKYIRVAWWPSAFAGLALSLTVFAVNVLGDWLRDFLDPRLRLEA
jgi:peptide/nickel transport system permease protein